MAEKKGIPGLSNLIEVGVKEGKNFLRHIVYDEILGFPTEGKGGLDPEHKKDKKNELALSMFRRLFSASPERFERAKILEKVFYCLKESDYLQFSLFILEAVTQSAYSTAQGNGALISSEISIFPPDSSDKKDDARNEGGKKGKADKKPSKAKVEKRMVPNLLHEANYDKIIKHVDAVIVQAKPNKGTANIHDVWVSNVIRRFSEDKIIAHTITAKLARYATPDEIAERWEKVTKKARKLRDSVTGELGKVAHQFGSDGAEFLAWAKKFDEQS